MNFEPSYLIIPITIYFYIHILLSFIVAKLHSKSHIYLHYIVNSTFLTNNIGYKKIFLAVPPRNMAYYNTVTFGAENSWSGSHETIIIIQLDFYSKALLSLAPIWGLRFFLDLCTWFSFILRIWLLTVYTTELTRNLCISQKNIPL